MAYNNLIPRTLLICLMLAALIPLLAPPIGAVSYFSTGTAYTMFGPTGRIVDLGIDYVTANVSQANYFYNLICILVLYLVAAAASKQSEGYFGIVLPIMAGLFMWMGWLRAPNQVVYINLLVGVGVLAALLYMKDALKVNFGIGGPGSTLMNIVIYIIIFQVVIGIVNDSGLFQTPSAPTPTTSYSNFNIQTAIATTSDTGGVTDAAASITTLLTTGAVAMLRVFVTILQSVVLFSSFIVAAYPWVLQSSFAMAILILFQVGIWLLYVLLLFNILYKPFPDVVGI
jgi:uncharacterized membrane protein